MAVIVPVGHTNERVFVKLRNTSAGTYGTAGEAAVAVPYTVVDGQYFIRGTSITPMDATSVLATAGTGHSTAHTDFAWHEVHATEAPGLYTFDVPDAAFATAGNVMISIVVPDCYTFDTEYQVGLDDVNVAEVDSSVLAAQNLSRGLQTMRYGLVDSGTFTPTSTAFETDTAGFSQVTNAYAGRKVFFYTGAGFDEGADITASSLQGANVRFTVSTMVTTAINNAEFVVV